MDSHDLMTLPPDLPRPVDDGACRHLKGMLLPAIRLRSTAGRFVALDRLPPGFSVLFFYPRTGRPGEEPLGGLAHWNAIPGARGCTPHTCGYRDAHGELEKWGVRVFGVSTQSTAYQQEMVARLGVPFDVLSDEKLELAGALKLPVFSIEGERLIQRLTLITENGRIEECLYPVFPPDADARNVLAWVRDRAKRLGKATPE